MCQKEVTKVPKTPINIHGNQSETRTPQRRCLFPIGHPDPEKTQKPLALFAPYRFNKNRAIRPALLN